MYNLPNSWYHIGDTASQVHVSDLDPLWEDAHTLSLGGDVLIVAASQSATKALNAVAGEHEEQNKEKDCNLKYNTYVYDRGLVYKSMEEERDTDE